jgi:hypothetical protein
MELGLMPDKKSFIELGIPILTVHYVSEFQFSYNSVDDANHQDPIKGVYGYFILIVQNNFTLIDKRPTICPWRTPPVDKESRAGYV